MSGGEKKVHMMKKIWILNFQAKCNDDNEFLIVV